MGYKRTTDRAEAQSYNPAVPKRSTSEVNPGKPGCPQGFPAHVPTGESESWQERSQNNIRHVLLMLWLISLHPCTSIRSCNSRLCLLLFSSIVKIVT